MENVTFKDLLTFKDGLLQLTLKFTDYAVHRRKTTLYFDTYLSQRQVRRRRRRCCAWPSATRSPTSWRAPGRPLQPALLMLVMLPFWTSFLLRVYAWKGLLSEGGWVDRLIVGAGLDHLLLAAGLIQAPGQLMNTPFSLVLGMVYTYLPFMVLPLYANLAKMDFRLLEAAYDLGATPWSAFWQITVPLSKAGIIAGSMLVFIPCVGEFVIPDCSAARRPS